MQNNSVWDRARLVAYVLGALGFLAALLAQMGHGTYDPVTFSYDPGPVDLRVVAGMIVTGLTPFLAAIAWLKGWTGKGPEN